MIYTAGGTRNRNTTRCALSGATFSILARYGHAYHLAALVLANVCAAKVRARVRVAVWAVYGSERAKALMKDCSRTLYSRTSAGLAACMPAPTSKMTCNQHKLTFVAVAVRIIGIRVPQQRGILNLARNRRVARQLEAWRCLQTRLISGDRSSTRKHAHSCSSKEGGAHRKESAEVLTTQKVSPLMAKPPSVRSAVIVVASAFLTCLVCLTFILKTFRCG